MKIPKPRLPAASAAFTLIELLVVIAIMAIIAALLFPVEGVVKKHEQLAVASSEIEQLRTALENYKSQYGSYPPGNAGVGASPGNPAINPLYYELSGVITNSQGKYQTLNGAAPILPTDYNTAFGVGGAVNSARAAGDEESARARDFLSGLRPSEFGSYTVSAGTTAGILITAVGGPDPAYLSAWQANGFSGNPVWYAYPGTNNPNSYDLWIDLQIGGKTNRICNWRSQAFTL